MRRIIDIHTHAFADAVAAKAIPRMVEASAETVTPYYDGTVSGLMAEMDRTGVHVSVVQPVATKASQVCDINDWASTMTQGRIIAFGAMHPDFEDPATEIARMQSLGIRGFKMHPEHQSFAPDEPRMRRVYEAAAEHGLIVLFHAGADLLHPTLHGTPESFAAVIDAFPDLTAILAHLGGWREWQGVAKHIAGRDVWLDTAYTPRHLPDDELVALVRAHGANRVLFGSDGPWADAAEEVRHLSGLGFTAEELDGILGGNAERLLEI